MVFSSLTFLPLFLPLVLLLYYLMRGDGVKNAVLLVFSLLFYAWGEPKWIFVMLLTVSVNYFCGIMIDKSKNQAARTLCMAVGVALSLAFLVYFKYFGFFSDVVMGLLANTCGIVTEKITAAGLSVAGSWLLAVSYAFQIYFDFSGYSDMAIGMGRMFGFKFSENFNYPYISKSITEFWRRWHISLGTFFRDYVYIPLGGNRVSK